MSFADSRYPLVASFELTDALFWDRRRPRLPTLPKVISVATNAGEDACGPSKRSRFTPSASLKGNEVSRAMAMQLRKPGNESTSSPHRY